MTNFLSNKIKHRRKILGLSLQALADSVNKSKAHIYEIEIGKIDPSITTVKAIAKVLDVPLLYLIDDNYNIGTYPHEPHYCKYCNALKQIKKIVND